MGDESSANFDIDGAYGGLSIGSPSSAARVKRRVEFVKAVSAVQVHERHWEKERLAVTGKTTQHESLKTRAPPPPPPSRQGTATTTLNTTTTTLRMAFCLEDGGGGGVVG